MAEAIRSILAGKKIMILGLGQEGMSTYKMIRSWFPDMFLTISDQDEAIFTKYPETHRDRNLGMVGGENYLDFFEHFDLVIKSPGIPYDLIAERCDPHKITSQTDLFLRAFASRVTGITGTKGKSTTATLIYHMMRAAGRKAILAGNIGIPPLNLADAIDDDTDVIFEMSSHQLEHISLSPQTAVLLNVFPEHLDHYKDFTAYKMAKFNISSKQGSGGKLIYNADDPIISELINTMPVNKSLQAFSLNDREAVSACYNGHEITCKDEKGLNHGFHAGIAHDLPGRHNVNNMMAAILVCLNKGLTDEEIIDGLKTYRRLPHRLEFVGEYKGVKFYDDSIATIPEACIEALKTLDRVDLLILGGHDRGLDYRLLFEKLKESPVPHLLFMGEAGKRMYSEWQHELSGNSALIHTKDFNDAFNYIRDVLKEGDVCLLSPAAASYGMFKNFEDRGEQFKKKAAAL
jgi:UDP-N-acetylmuramoylalanine--D-glutamate ligase